ncbi:Bacterial alpha-L-rhamnosidase [compost metagenome]
MKNVKYGLIALAFFAFNEIIKAQDRIVAVNLHCDQKESPVGIANSNPEFRWEISATQRSFQQSAFQVQVFSKAKNAESGKADLWDSQKMNAGSAMSVVYRGEPLVSGKRYYWRVRIWSANGKPSEWSRPTSFSTGILNAKEWDKSHWIAYQVLEDSMKVVPGLHGNGESLGKKAVQPAVVPYFRRLFNVQKPIAEAYVFVSGLGHYELQLNGKKVGDDFLAPGWTNYAKTNLYNTYDVTAALVSGKNALGAIVGPGFMYVNRERYRKMARAEGFPMLRLKLLIRYKDGSIGEVVTDGSWKTSPSPIVFSSIYGGEDYNAGLEQPGWASAGFNDQHWKKVVLLAGLGGEMKAETSYPLKVMQTFEPQTIRKITDSSYLYDFGQNASGIIRLKVKGKKGDRVRIIPAEILTVQGMPDQKASGSPYYFDYTLKGGTEEIWEPRFSYYGFRYALIEGGVPAGQSGMSDKPLIQGLQMLHTRNSLPEVGTFSCSNTLFNQTFKLIDWAMKSNMSHVSTDCPHREKLGWLEQTHLVGGSLKYNYDIQLFYNKIIDDMAESQLSSGLVPDIVPEYVVFDDGFRDSPEWGSAAIIIPWYLYKWYGDKKAIEKAYPMMKRYLSYLESKAEAHILSHGLGDWFDLGPKEPGESQLTPKSLTATATFFYDADLLGQIANVLGKTEDAKGYRKLAGSIKKAFNKKFFQPETGIYSTGSQTSYAMALYMGLVDESFKEKVFANLKSSIQQSGYALTAGDIGYRYLIRVLEEGGASQLLYRMNNRDDVPGYGYQIRSGATALTESWPALKNVSNNHMMLGHLMEWFYSGLAGIKQQEGDIGFSKILIEPQFVEGIEWLKASYKAVSGRIAVDWKKEQRKVYLQVIIPANTEALVVLPISDTKLLKLNQQPLDQRKEFRKAYIEKGKLKIVLGSGTYVLDWVK